MSFNSKNQNNTFPITKITLCETDYYIVTIPFYLVAHFLPIKQRLDDLNSPFFVRLPHNIVNKDVITVDDLNHLKLFMNIRISFFGRKIEHSVDKLGHTCRLVQLRGGGTRPELLDYLRKKFGLCDIQSRDDLDNVGLFTIWIANSLMKKYFSGKIDIIKSDDNACPVCFEEDINIDKWYCSTSCECARPLCASCESQITQCIICRNDAIYLPMKEYTIGIVPSRLNAFPDQILKMHKIIYDDYISILRDNS